MREILSGRSVARELSGSHALVCDGAKRENFLNLKGGVKVKQRPIKIHSTSIRFVIKDIARVLMTPVEWVNVSDPVDASNQSR